MIDPIQLSCDLIKYQSITPDNVGTIEFLSNLLSTLGFKCQKFIFNDPIYQAPVHNLYARLGENGKNLCFAGHTDVVPVGDLKAWSVDPFSGTIIKDRLYGRGSTDMKCAIACFISAIQKLIMTNNKLFIDNSISLLITGDEEGHAANGTPKVLNILQSQQEHIDICLIGEPSNPTKFGEMIKIGRRGSLNATLAITGKQGHVAYPEHTHNPIKDLIKAFNILTLPLDAGNEYFQPSNLEFTSIDVGNDTRNIIPNKAYAKFNIRFNNNYTVNQLIDTIQDRLNSINIDYSLNTETDGEAFISQPKQFCAIIAQAIKEITHISPTLGTTGGTSDGRFIQNICPVVEFGLVAATAHQVDEFVLVKDVYNLKEIYEKIIQNYLL